MLEHNPRLDAFSLHKHKASFLVEHVCKDYSFTDGWNRLGELIFLLNTLKCLRQEYVGAKGALVLHCLCNHAIFKANCAVTIAYEMLPSFLLLSHGFSEHGVYVWTPSLLVIFHLAASFVFRLIRFYTETAYGLHSKHPAHWGNVTKSNKI